MLCIFFWIPQPWATLSVPVLCAPFILCKTLIIYLLLFNERAPYIVQLFVIGYRGTSKQMVLWNCWLCPKLNGANPARFTHVRSTSHMSQEPWPCNGEDPWLSSKGRTMGVGKVVLCSHGSSSIIVWSENGPCCRSIAYSVGKKEGRIWFNLIYLKLYQFKRITWWRLSILKSIL